MKKLQPTTYVLIAFLVVLVLLCFAVPKEVQVKPKKVPEVQSEQAIINSAMARNVSVHSENGRGSGVIVKTGLVVSAFHNIHIGEKLMVNGKETVILKVDPFNDLMLLKAETPEVTDLQFVDRVFQSMKVFSVSNPLYHKGLMSFGRIADIDKGRFFSDLHVLQGSSGGGVYSEEGKLVGVIAAVEGIEGMGFAFSVIVPFSPVKNLLE